MLARLHVGACVAGINARLPRRHLFDYYGLFYPQTYYSTLLADTGHVMKNGSSYGAHAGICLETQRHANAESASAPTRLLSKGDVYRQETVLAFSVE